MPPRSACARAGDTDKTGSITQLESRNRGDEAGNQLRDVIASRLPPDIPEADREAVLARAVQIASAAQESLIRVAIEIGFGDPASSLPKSSVPRDFSVPTRPSVRPEERIAYRIEEVVALTGVSRTLVSKHIGPEIRFRKLGGLVLLDPEDVHRTFGFIHDEHITPSRESLAEIEELLS